MHFSQWFNEFVEDDQANLLIDQFARRGKAGFSRILMDVKTSKGSQAVIDFATKKFPDDTTKILQAPPDNDPLNYLVPDNQDVLRTPVAIPAKSL